MCVDGVVGLPLCNDVCRDRRLYFIGEFNNGSVRLLCAKLGTSRSSLLTDWTSGLVGGLDWNVYETDEAIDGRRRIIDSPDASK